MFRYPGGKSRLYKKIEPYLINKYNGSLTVPFAGAGHEISRFLKIKTPRFLWINDIDPSITAFWKAINYYPLKFLNKLKRYKPSVDDFFIYKKYLEELDFCPKGVEDITDVALKKLVIHQISYSGLGCMAGGPIGGKDQSSKYDVACRWNQEQISKNIISLNESLQNSEVKITTWDFEEVLSDKKNIGLIYLDPPYYDQGNKLYKHSMSPQDHWRLSEILYNKKHWVLSYDDHPIIRSFYNFTDIHEIDVIYSIKTARKKRELIIVG